MPTLALGIGAFTPTSRGVLAATPQDVRPSRVAAPGLAPSIAGWRSDLAILVHTIDSAHPWPWRRVTASEFHRAAAELSAQIPALPPEQRATRMMALVALLGDGHTTLEPAGVEGFDWWFPVRFVQFSDAVVVTAADSADAELAGSTVLRLGGQPAESVARRVAALSGADNVWGARERTGLLSNAATLRALGVLSRQGTLSVEVAGTNGPHTVQLTARHTQWGDAAWMQRGEMFGPPGIPVVTDFRHLTPLEFRKSFEWLPPHLRNRIPIWFTMLPDSVLYVQSNFVQDFNGTSFASVVDSIFALADQRPVRRMILDLRYNSGGDGSKVLPFVHEIIRRPRLDQPGQLIVMVGAKTFSAAVLWLSLMREHTGAVIVGEPAGAPRNHSGDPGTIVLPATGMLLQFSTLRHYGTRSDDSSRAEVPDFPVSMSSADYFAGRDPALDYARTASDLRSIPQIAVALGAGAALAEAQQRVARFGSFAGWHPFDEGAMNSAGYALLRAGKTQDAVAAFRANTVAYPASGNVWDSFGESLLAAGDTTDAVASYRRAAALDPGNDNARAIVARLGKR